MIKTITGYQSLTFSMIIVPKFQQTVKITYTCCYTKMNRQREKTCFREKKLFSGGFGFFSNLRGGVDQEVCVYGARGRVDQHSFFRGIALRGPGLRGVLPSMVTLPLFHLHFHMSITSCQTKFSQLQKMLLVSHKQFFAKTRLCIYA